MRPTEEMKLHFARAVLQYKRALVKRLLRVLGCVPMHLGYIRPAFGRGLPARRLIPLHLLSHALICQGCGAGRGPDGIAVGVVAVVVRIEDVFDGLI